MSAADRERIEAIRERAGKASEGPWQNGTNPPPSLISDNHMGRVCAMRERDGQRFGEVVAVTWHPQHLVTYVGLSRQQTVDNAEFIAHAREDVPWLLSQLSALAEALSAAHEELERLKATTT